jgi:hypothetical protein
MASFKKALGLSAGAGFAVGLATYGICKLAHIEKLSPYFCSLATVKTVNFVFKKFMPHYMRNEQKELTPPPRLYVSYRKVGFEDDEPIGIPSPFH